MSSTLKTAFSVYNGYAPNDTPKALPIAFDLTSVSFTEVDLLLENTQGVIGYVQSIYVDNSNNPEILNVLFYGTMQRLTVPAFAQGIWPVFSADQVKFKISTIPNDGATGNIILLNVPMPLTQWGPITVNTPSINVNTVPYTAVLSDSGSTVAPSVAAEFIGANANRKGLLITALETNVQAVRILSNAFPLVVLLPGQTWQSSEFVPREALSSVSATGMDAEFSWHEYE